MRRSFALLPCLLFVTIAFAHGASATGDEPRFPTCEDEFLTLSPAVHALRIHPPFRNFDLVRARVEFVREYGQPYLSATELVELQRAFDDVVNDVGNVYSHRRAVAVLLNTAEDNLAREFQAHVDEVEAALRRKAEAVLAQDDFEYHRWLSELLVRIDHYRGGVSIELSAWYWQHARYEASQSPEPEPELPESVTARRPSILLAAPRFTQGDFEWVMDLTNMTNLRKNSLRFAMQHAFTAAGFAVAVELAPTYQVAHVADLDRALSFLEDGLRPSKHAPRLTLEGSASIGGVVTPVSIHFDSRLRTFTVRTVSADPASARYYQMLAGADGRLQFVDAPPVSEQVALHRLDLTHFTF